MPEFIIQCISRASGKPYSIHIAAPTAAAAEELAMAEGHIITPGSATADPASIAARGQAGDAAASPAASLLCAVLGVLLLIAGAFYLVAAAVAPIAAPVAGVVNIGLLADRQLYATLGLALVTPGTGLLILAAVLRR